MGADTVEELNRKPRGKPKPPVKAIDGDMTPAAEMTTPPAVETTSHRERMRQRFRDPELRERLRQANLGRVMSEETKEKIRQAHLRRYAKPVEEGADATS